MTVNYNTWEQLGSQIELGVEELWRLLINGSQSYLDSCLLCAEKYICPAGGSCHIFWEIFYVHLRIYKWYILGRFWRLWSGIRPRGRGENILVCLEKTVWRQLAAKWGFREKKVPFGNYDFVWGSLYWWILNAPLGKWLLCLGLSSSFPLIFLLLVSWSASFLLFPFSPKLQIDNSTVHFKHISMNYFVWGVIHHLILFSTHQLLSFFSIQP